MNDTFFLYGAGPTPGDLARACRVWQLQPGALESLGPAYLPDCTPVWADDGRGAARLSATAHPAHLLPGLLLQASAAGATHLRGSGDWSEVATLRNDGRVVWAWTCGVCREAWPVRPDPVQVDRVRTFLNVWGIDATPVLHAAAGEPVPPLSDVFAYGTLRHGEPNAPLLEPASVEPGYMSGRLWSLGAYPVLTPAAEPDRVLGELRHCPDLPRRLQKLDELEDFTGYHAQSMYWRVLGQVHTHAGDRLAWLWQMNDVPAGAVAIPSGDWRDRNLA